MFRVIISQRTVACKEMCDRMGEMVEFGSYVFYTENKKRAKKSYLVVRNLALVGEPIFKITLH